MMLLTLVLAMSAAPPQTPRPAATPPRALVQLSEAAESLFDAAYASKWLQASKELTVVASALGQLPRSVGNTDERTRLQRHVQDLTREVRARRRIETLRVANTLTRLTIDLSGAFQTKVPVEVPLLDYYGRQLEIGIASGRLSTLRRASADIRQAWNDLRPQLDRRGRTTDARRFTDIVVDLERGRSVADFVKPAHAELNAVDDLEKAFGG